MKKKIELSKDEKLFFIYKYLGLKQRYEKSKRARKVFGISSIIFALASGVLGLFNFTAAYYTLFFGALVIAPTIYLMTGKVHDIINEITTDRITYRRFKKMLKSGEIDKLIEEYNNSLNVPKSLDEKLIDTKTKKDKTYEKNNDFSFLLNDKNNDLSR